MTLEKIKIGIIGGAGYTGGELLRILLHHPRAEIAFVHSISNAGNQISDVHADLFGETDLRFTDALQTDVDVLFFCLGHGKSAEFLQANPLPESMKIIDLSQDFRDTSNGFIYGLPELNRERINAANRVANPGCFATAIQLALLPLAKAGLLNEEIHVSAITGSTGAGQSLSPTTHFSWRNNNVSVYKPFQHQHLREIRQSLRSLQPSFKKQINFIPYRGDFTRGIFASAYLPCELDESEAVVLFTDFYAPHPFVRISPQNPNLKQVVNTNNNILHLEKHDDTLLIISVIDNLVKGASGQAVQNMNLMFSLEETAGLRLKPVAF